MDDCHAADSNASAGFVDSSETDSSGASSPQTAPTASGQPGRNPSGSHATALTPADPGQAESTRLASEPSNSVPAPSCFKGWRPLPPRVRTVWLINEAIQCAIWLAACGVITAICLTNGWWGFWQRLIVGIAVIYAVLELVSQPLQTKYMYAFTRFRIGERDLATRKGWLFRNSTTTPYTRVQHVDTKQNPVQRHFGLTTVVVHTAADEHEIAALDTAEAERIVALITERVAVAKDDM
ncbi:PH domain-containing protein [Bifidobacterium myosotis]|uniref:YdbS-like PH domain-containing protein n=1 Tax=Bifidobacterium myosotis TaxID=1630166 RepID=A0A5M9ZHG4_9BIFI|nr:PH domain-containing protein [Bifidobacterium myosotis]KAA8826567.1 hypothetical protein EMO91_10960 [Bifidobacterium myosotis]